MLWLCPSSSPEYSHALLAPCAVKYLTGSPHDFVLASLLGVGLVSPLGQVRLPRGCLPRNRERIRDSSARVRCPTQGAMRFLGLVLTVAPQARHEI